MTKQDEQSAEWAWSWMEGWIRNRRARLVAIALLGTLGLAPMATLAEPRGRRAPKVVENWQKRLRSADDLLRDGEYRAARKRLNTLLHEMCNRIESGPGAAPLLAMATLLRSIAEAGLGNEQDAHWDMGMAEALQPELGQADLSAYGAAAEVLAARPSAGTERLPGPVSLVTPEITPPRRLRDPAPKYPLAKRIACLEAPVVVSAVIGVDGVPVRPGLLSREYPVLGLAALETLRTWRFKPARSGEKPVAVLYTLTVNYQIPLCGNPLAIRERSKADG